MKYLFFDIECANTADGVSSMCSFGYVLTNEYLDVLEEDDFFINPESTFNSYALKNILPHSKEFYESYPNFEYYYKRIKELFNSCSLAFGHGITNDIKYLNDACIRYDLPYIDFTYYDGADIYKNFSNDKNSKSLEIVSFSFCNEKQGNKHESKKDAYLVRDYLKKITFDMHTTMKEILPLVSECKGENRNGFCLYNGKVITNNRLMNKHNLLIMNYYLNNIKVNENELLKDKVICIASSYEARHFRELLLIIHNISILGGKYTFNIEEANLYVKNEAKKNKKEPKEYYAEENSLEIMKMDDFLKLINYEEEQVNSNYASILKKYRNKVTN